MDLNKKDIIYQLAKGVHSKMKPQAYGRLRGRLTENQRVSEIGLYSAVAQHLEENDIDPNNYIDDMVGLLADVSHNVFVLKTDDKYHFLKKEYTAVSMSNSAESQGKFLCNKCFTVKNSEERCERPNYKNSCNDCIKIESRETAKRSAQNKKKKQLEENKTNKTNKTDEAVKCRR